MNGDIPYSGYMCLLETVKTLRRASVVFLRVNHLCFKPSWSSSFRRVRLLFLLCYYYFFFHIHVATLKALHKCFCQCDEDSHLC